MNTIPPTLTFEETPTRPWDVIVVGAGPAGATAARESARRGLSVLLIDKAEFPRWKVCGSCINLRAHATLNAIGLGDLLENHAAIPVQALHLASWKTRAAVPLPGEKILSRAAFDAALVQAAILAGVYFLPQTPAHLGLVSKEKREVHLRHENRETTIAAKVVLDAAGLGDSFQSGKIGQRAMVDPHARIGAGGIAEKFPVFYEAPNIFMACGTGGYVGLVRLENGRLNLAAAFDPGHVRRSGSLAKAAMAVLDEAGFPPIPGLETISWRGTPLLTRRVSLPARERLFLLGDAAGYVEPFTGEGMAWALASAAAIAPLVESACRRWQPELMAAWSQSHRRIITSRQWMCRTVAQVLRRPLLTHGVVRLLALVPILAGPVIRYLNR